jgi:hypothetical protein
MNTSFRIFTFCSLLLATSSGFAQEDGYHIGTVFKRAGNQHRIGGFGAATNKLTSIRGKHANIVEVYGGWYVNHRWLIGIAAASNTNVIPVPVEFSTLPPEFSANYQYGQFGLMTEYVFASNKAVHVAFQLFAGPGFTVQYKTHDTDYNDYWNDSPDYDDDQNWFRVLEPGVKLEVNLFRWLRFCPGVSYRMTKLSQGKGLSDDDLTGTSLNMTLKIGKF